MIRVSTKITRVFFSTQKFNRPPQQFDAANALGINDVGEPIMSLGQKLTFFKPSVIYHNLDQFSRELLFTLSDDYAMGIGGSVICISLFIKLLFMYPTIVTQFNGIKMQSIKGQLDKMNEKVKLARMTNNMALMKQAQKQFNYAKQKRGIDNFVSLISFLQIPIMITWFLSLRYVTNLPQIYPTIQTDGFLWFKDLSVYDPYFLLPLGSAIVTSLSIIYSPSLSSNSMVSNSPLGQFSKYLKFLPFVSLPLTGMFPAAINLYWFTMALSQLLLVLATRTKILQQRFGITKQILKPVTVKAVLVQQKDSNISQQTSPQPAAKDEKIILTTSKKPKKKKQ